MRNSAPWMTIWDDRILEYIREHGSGSPKELDDSGYVHVSKPQISRRLGKLRDYGLLTHLGNGIYIITDEGKQYLDGDLDAGSLSVEEGENDENGATAT